MLAKFSHAACIRVAAIFLAVLATSAVFAAESKVLNIGWTGGSAWTALPDRIAPLRKVMNCKMATRSQRD